MRRLVHVPIGTIRSIGTVLPIVRIVTRTIKIGIQRRVITIRKRDGVRNVAAGAGNKQKRGEDDSGKSPVGRVYWSSPPCDTENARRRFKSV